jgi:adenosine deaminase
MSTSRGLAALPKAHLHLHLEGAMRPATLAELAAAAGIAVPEVRGSGSFAAFADQYVAACQVLRTEADLRRLVREVVEDAHVAGAVWVEPQTWPGDHRERLARDEVVVDVVLDEGRATAARLGIGFGLMVAADRTRPPEEAVALARLAAERAGAGVVSFGLANAEAGFPPEPFAEAFRLARDAGLIPAPHAGEHAGPESVAGALDALGARRIGHGVRAVEDPALVDRLAQDGVCLDVCRTSNLLLSVVPDAVAHPLPALLAAGVRCSIGADDPLLFGPGLLEEYERARTDLGLDDGALARVARCSIEASGAPESLKAEALRGVDAWEGAA